MAVRKRKTAWDFPHAHSHMHVSRRASCLGAPRGQNDDDDDDDADGGDGGGDDDNDMRSRLAAGHARPSVGLADRFPF